MPQTDTFRFSISFPTADTESVEGLVWLESPAGIEENESAGQTRYTIYFTDQESAEAARESLLESGYAGSEIEKIVPQDWNAKWRETMEPAKLADGVWVSPEWLPPPMAEGDAWIRIEPKMAFGTGHHETTRLAAQAILSNARKHGGALLDVGTGSGVLCFAAKLAGYASALGVEIDSDCEENLAENLALNTDYSEGVEFLIGGIDLAQGRKFDCIVMNMIRTESDPCIEPASHLLTDGGLIVRSGILVEEKDSVIAWMKDRGFACSCESSEGEWWGGVFGR